MSFRMKKNLLSWVQNRLIAGKIYKNIWVKNFNRSWSNGLAFAALVHSFDPTLFDYEALKKGDAKGNLDLAFKSASKLGIPALLDVEDVTDFEKPDDVIIITYLTGFYSYFKKNKDLIATKQKMKGKKTKKAPKVPPKVPIRSYKRINK